jgi:hypothetical protein
VRSQGDDSEDEDEEDSEEEEDDGDKEETFADRCVKSSQQRCCSWHMSTVRQVSGRMLPSPYVPASPIGSEDSEHPLLAKYLPAACHP